MPFERSCSNAGWRRNACPYNECVSDIAANPWFESEPSIMGGATVFAGTRVPLRTVLASLAEGDSFADIMAAFPALTAEHLAAAVQFAAQAAMTKSDLCRLGPIPHILNP